MADWPTIRLNLRYRWKTVLMWGIGGALVLVSSIVHAATLDIPGEGTTLSGIGVVSGWKCEAGELTVRFNGDTPIPLVYGSERKDVLEEGVCDHANVGFVAIWNWGNLGDGAHTAVVYDNGVEFDRAMFTVLTPGVAFLEDVTGLGTATLSNGQAATLKWSEAAQGFVVTGWSSPNTQCVEQEVRVHVDNGYGASAVWYIETRRADNSGFSGLKMDITIPYSEDLWYLNDLTFTQEGRTVYYCGTGQTPQFWDDYQSCSQSQFDCEDFYDGQCHAEITSDDLAVLDFREPFQVFYQDKQIVCFN